MVPIGTRHSFLYIPQCIRTEQTSLGNDASLIVRLIGLWLVIASQKVIHGV